MKITHTFLKTLTQLYINNPSIEDERGTTLLGVLIDPETRRQVYNGIKQSYLKSFFEYDKEASLLNSYYREFE